jgi:hypothetical protein
MTNAKRPPYGGLLGNVDVSGILGVAGSGVLSDSLTKSLANGGFGHLLEQSAMQYWLESLPSFDFSQYAGSVVAGSVGGRVQDLFDSSRFVSAVETVGAAEKLLQLQPAYFSGLSSMIERVTSSLALMDLPPLLDGVLEQNAQTWVAATLGLGANPSSFALERAESLGFGMLHGTTAVGLFVEPVVDEDFDLDDVDDADVLLRQPVLSEQMDLALRARLEELHPHLPARLAGAWERVELEGPDAASQAAHSLAEVLAWALRLAAPDDDVREWHAAERRPKDELRDGRPTRAAQVRYILRSRSVDDSEAAQLAVRSVNHLFEALQGHKHSAEPAELGAVRRMIPMVEGVLIYVLL